MSVILKDVAKEAGVSVPTVSRVVNNQPHVRETTRKKVMEAIEKLSYQPDAVARNLKQGKTSTVGFIVPDISSSFFGTVALGIEKVLRKYNYNLILCNMDGKHNLEIESLKLVVSKKVEGIILATVGSTGEFVERIINQHKVPVVVIDNKVKGLRTDIVLHDNVGGAYKLTSHLLDHGHKRIALIGGPLNETSGEKRLEGYKKALILKGLPIREELIKTGDWKKESGFRVTKRLLELKRLPTAIFAANTFMALGSLIAFHEEGLTVPDDIALVSFDDLEFASALDPPLTTLAELDIEIGTTAANLLLKRMRKKVKEEPVEIYLPAELLIRGSCGCKRLSDLRLKGDKYSEKIRSGEPGRSTYRKNKRSATAAGRISRDRLNKS